jgi:HK97 family phage prohead protease
LFSAILIKSVNEDAREFEGIASTPTPDRVKDTINPLGLSYEKETPLLLNHKSDQPVGTVKFGAPTKKGLPFKATIPKIDEEGTVKQRTDEAWHSVKSGLVKGVSIGFIPQEYNYKDDGGVHFDKAAVHELSLTAIPCNPEAMITAFKSLHESEGAAASEVPGETPGQLPQGEQPEGVAAAPVVPGDNPEVTTKAVEQAQALARLLSVRLYS